MSVRSKGYRRAAGRGAWLKCWSAWPGPATMVLFLFLCWSGRARDREKFDRHQGRSRQAKTRSEG